MRSFAYLADASNGVFLGFRGKSDRIINHLRSIIIYLYNLIHKFIHWSISWTVFHIRFKNSPNRSRNSIILKLPKESEPTLSCPNHDTVAWRDLYIFLECNYTAMTIYLFNENWFIIYWVTIKKRIAETFI